MKKIMTISLLLAMSVLSVSAQCENCSNEAINNIMTRTSIRQYTDEPVSKADIETMLRAGMAAPTAVNRQPWHFVVINSKEKLAELAGNNPRGGMLKLPQAFIPLCTIVIGHPAEQPQPKDKWKPENVSYNEYGGKAE
jgi:nitroreductase